MSKKHPQGGLIYGMLSQGLNDMRMAGLIKKAYTEAGFFNHQVRDWVLVNSQPAQK